MNATEAYDRLISEGANPIQCFVHSRGASDDAIGLIKDGNQWKVFYTERGCDSPPMFTSELETEAAEFFYHEISKQRHWHLVGFFEEEKNAHALEEELKSINIHYIRNDIPNYKFTGDRRFRVFVVGADIFPARAKIGNEVKTET